MYGRECISQDPISVLIKYRASFSEALLQKVIEIPINPLDVLSQTSNDNSKIQTTINSLHLNFVQSFDTSLVVNQASS
ncbi:hypothetical protein SCLCIDRAFT_1212846 [Scleroderma citrinum Foug A]|uniref:Uncharacterized protein n=1 Tax=Scleroderma citrinum Foug A TaxID=1036808 RepID=A0A0C3E9W5_9AGAM|nr:hypothetical protein SCLCIDRAFT_1212846 [Scleroderma citrinum Foug A]